MMAILSLLALAFLYQGALLGWSALRERSLMDPFVPLAGFISPLFILSAISSTAISTHVFFHSKDLELYGVAPIPPLTFFIARWIDTFLYSGLLVVSFSVPLFVALGAAFDAPLHYWPALLVGAGVTFALANSLGILLSFAVARALPPRFAKEISVVLLAIGIIALLLTVVSNNESKTQAWIHAAQSLQQHPSTLFLPPVWVAWDLRESLFPNTPIFGFGIGASFLLLILVSRICYAVFKTNFSVLSDSIRSEQRMVYLRSSLLDLIASLAGCLIPPQKRTLIGKELRLLVREPTHGVQFLLLLGVAVFYVTQLRKATAPARTSPELEAFWHAALIISNLGMGAFIGSAITTRFAFPSISFEGQSLWVLLSAPIGLRDILNTKARIFWILLTSVVSVVVLSGTLALDASSEIMSVSLITAATYMYGLCGLAVGLGGCFAKFEWEHPSQISSSLGSLLFLIASSVLLFVQLVPLSILLALEAIHQSVIEIAGADRALFAASLLIPNILVSRYVWRTALRAGENALLEKIE